MYFFFFFFINSHLRLFRKYCLNKLLTQVFTGRLVKSPWVFRVLIVVLVVSIWPKDFGINGQLVPLNTKYYAGYWNVIFADKVIYLPETEFQEANWNANYRFVSILTSRSAYVYVVYYPHLIIASVSVNEGSKWWLIEMVRILKLEIKRVNV